MVVVEEAGLVVIGGGPGGYVAAIRASQLGLKPVLVESTHLGGICLNWGCIPTKALLRSADVAHILSHLGDYGFSASNIKADLTKIVERSRKIAAQLSGGVSHLLRKNKVRVIDGRARLDGGGHLTVTRDGRTQAQIKSPHIIIATGARPRQLEGIEADGKLVWTYREAMVPTSLPARLLVIGSGAIGMEFASFYRAMGSEVTVVEVLDRVLPVEDAEISTLARKQFEKQGIRIFTSARVTDLARSNDGATATIVTENKPPLPLSVDRVILAVGITGNVEDIGLENTRVKVDRGHICVDGALRTDEPGVYAIGDVSGPPWLAHKASHEGVLCVETIAGVKGLHPLNTLNIPGCTYCTPQIASVGLTETKAREAGHKVRVGRFPFIGNGKAIALGEPDGLIKTVFNAATGELLGAHMIGAEVTELIQGYVIAKTAELTEAELMHTIFPHPTLSEMMHESVLDAWGRAIHY